MTHCVAVITRLSDTTMYHDADQESARRCAVKNIQVIAVALLLLIGCSENRTPG